MSGPRFFQVNDGKKVKTYKVTDQVLVKDTRCELIQGRHKRVATVELQRDLEKIGERHATRTEAHAHKPLQNKFTGKQFSLEEIDPPRGYRLTR